MGAIDSHLKAFVSTEFNTGRIGRLSAKRLSLAIGYIREHLADDVRLKDIAGAAGLSTFHFSRAFRNTTGVAPYGYLRQARVERVRELLVGSDKTLSQIATEAGFSDQSHMSKIFKRFTGVAPRAFRNRATS
ncbi:MAG: helix-turn-helix transcriptional regulator [Betaproteobacteria bacterium]|nr:helix-turn-helix transcriptional regulator [Betaproteobacteria bacterium]